MSQTECDNPAGLDLTPYCWKLQASSDRRVRLVLFCVPQLEDELCERLNRIYKTTFRVHARGSLRLDIPAEILAMVQALGPDQDLLNAVTAWAQTWDRCRRGVPTSVDIRMEQGRWVNRILHLQGLNEE